MVPVKLLVPVVLSVPLEALMVVVVPVTLELLRATAAAVSVTFVLPDVLMVRVAALVLLAVTAPEPEVRNKVPAEVIELPPAVSVIAPEPLAFKVKSPLVVVTEALVPTVMVPLLAVLSAEVPLAETAPVIVRSEPELTLRAPVVSVPPRVVAPFADN